MPSDKRFSSLYNAVMRRALLPLALAAGLLVLTACFDPPVRESVHLRFLPNGMTVVTSSVDFDPLVESDSNAALTRRLADLRRDLLDGLDPWTRRFESASPAAERFSWEKRLGIVSGARRSVLLDEPGKLASLFGDTSISVSYEVRAEESIAGAPEIAELAIVPGVPSMATRKQRKDVETALAEWSAAVSRYLEATADLYGWLEDNPSRVEACFAELFGDALDEDSLPPEGSAELSPEEKARVDKVGDAMGEVLGVLMIPEGQDRSLDELSHLVYDPFPAPLAIQLPSEPLELEGFAPSLSQDKTWTVDSPGLWTALRSLEDRWVSPDPVLIYVDHEGPNARKIDLSALMDAPRRVMSPLPNSLEVRRTIEERLKPAASMYRVAFRVDPASDDEFSWED